MSELRPIAHCMFVAMALVLLVCPALCRLAAQTAPATPPATPPPPPRFTPTPEQLAIQAASEKGHKRMMDLLGIKELRRGADGDAKSPNAANYDESKADVYPTLPDPLVLENGKRVTSAKVWWTKRRPEIVEDFDREIYGRVPANLPKVTWEVVSTTAEKNADVPVVTKRLLGHVDNSAYPAIKVDIDLTLTTPANATGPVPVIMEFGFSREFMAAMAKRFPQMAAGGGPGNQGPTWQQQVLARGWGYAELVPTSYQADNGAGLTEGIIGLMNKGQPRKVDDWGALRAWAWGASRALDYFETDKSVDAKQVGLEGHSRYGKATLVTMAYEPRLAIAYLSSSGEGGAKLYRHIFGEQVGNVAGTSEYHWMAGNFLKYAGPLTVGDLPVDNHELVALCAPRPVFISGGATNGDGWADAKGMFLAAVGAGPVYRLLGKKDLGTTEFPPIETALIDGDVAFRQHSGGHTPGPNWPTFLNFASRYLHAPPTAGAAAAQTGTVSPRPVRLTAEQDHQRLMDLLGIKELRPGAGNDAKSPNAANYDESKANVYPNLPDPLVLKNGKRVTSAETWWSERRPEIVEDFDREILGRAPANLPRVTWEVVSTTPETIGDVPVVTKKLTGHVDNSAYPSIEVNIGLTLTTPAHAAGPVPVIMELAFSKEFMASITKSIPEMIPGGPGNQGIPWQQQVLARGWGYAILTPTSYQADDGAGLIEGIIGLMNKGQPRKLDDWGTLRAWAWGASRALDYFETDNAVDARQVGLEGHSRFGKTALVTMAYDPRFAIVYSSSSGEGGAKLYRHIFGEPLANLVSSRLYQWMAGNLLKYAGPLTPGDLPVDSHELIALVAPRPVFIGAGASVENGNGKPRGDGWADARGMFLAEVGAGPVYRLLGKKDLGTTEFPPIETALIDGDLAFRQHSFGHTPGPNWPAFLDFASRYLHAPEASSASSPATH
jgi:dienelactone hydrolase